MPDLATCRSCRARIRWVVMDGTGRRNPLNPDPDPQRGNVLIITGDRAAALSADEAVRHRLAGDDLFLSHFATCSASDHHRRKQ